MLGSAPRGAVERTAPGLAHGAPVAPPGSGAGAEDAHGALVGWFGPAGTAGPWAREGMREEAQGAAVPLPLGPPPFDALGAAVTPGSASGSRITGWGLAVGAFDFG